MQSLLSSLRTPMKNYPGAFGLFIGFSGVYFALSIWPAVLENLLVSLILFSAISIALTVQIWSERIPIIVMVFCACISCFVVAVIFIQGLKIFNSTEVLIERSVITVAIATFFLTSLKIAVEAWRAWKENVYKEQDIKLRSEIFRSEILGRNDR